ncbi:unnamed protein product [Effrenium voratum]|nr:unnamed protein product [Effrenium voratum]
MLVFLADLTAGLTALRLRQEELTRCFRLCWVPQQLLDQLAAAKGDPEQILCFEAVQSVSRSEPWRCLELLPQGCAPCLLDFDERIARVAVDVSLAAGHLAELLLPAFLRAQVVSLEEEQAPAPYHFPVFRLKIAGFRETECSLEQMHSPPEAVLAASLLLGLQRSRASEEPVESEFRGLEGILVLGMAH